MSQTDLEARIRAIITQPRLAALATVTEDCHPWARYMMVVGDEDLTLRCATFKRSRKVAQIVREPEVHVLTGVTDPALSEPYLQIQGWADYDDTEQARHSFWIPYLKKVFSGPDDPNYAVIVIQPYRIELCSPGTLKPEVWERPVV